VSDVSQLEIREATIQDEAELFRMMRLLAEQKPEKIQFDEFTARATFRRFLALPLFGRVWLLREGNVPVGHG